MSSRAAFTLGVGTSILCAFGITPKLGSFAYCQVPSIEVKDATISSLSKEDNKRLVAAVDEALARVLQWVDASIRGGMNAKTFAWPRESVMRNIR